MTISKRLPGPVFAAFALCAPAIAAMVDDSAPPATPGFNLFAKDGTLDSGVMLNAPPAVALKAGGMAMAFEATSLVEISNELGGDIHHASDGGDSVYWLCYTQPGSATTPAAIVWFQSGEMGGDQHTLGAIAVETAPTAIPAECVEPKKKLDLETGLPGLGAKTADLTAAFAPSAPKDDLLVYLHEGTAPEGTVITFLGYRLEGDLVSAYHFGQVTTH